MLADRLSVSYHYGLTILKMPKERKLTKWKAVFFDNMWLVSDWYSYIWEWHISHGYVCIKKLWWEGILFIWFFFVFVLNFLFFYLKIIAISLQCVGNNNNVQNIAWSIFIFCNILQNIKRLWYRCFPVNFARFKRKLFLQNTSRQLLLQHHQFSGRKLKNFENK